MKLLTKSRYVLGLKCLRSLWYSANKPSEIPKPSPASLHRMEQGIWVGEKAQVLWKGIDCGARGNIAKELSNTQEALKKRVPLFEAGFQVGDCYARADVLLPVEGAWDLIEVKSGTHVKEEHIHDVAFQKFIYERAGLKIRNCFLMHTNKDFVKDGSIDWKKFFGIFDITEEVNTALTLVPDLVEELLTIMRNDKPPSRCETPKKCEAPSLCWSDLPSGNVFELSRGGAKAISLYEDGVKLLKDIPPDFKLTSKQEIQVQCAKSGKVFRDPPKIKEFLNRLEYPLYFMDFEAFSACVPLFDGDGPYKHVPFQFSVHIQKKKGGEVKHFEFLHPGKDDPRKEFLKALKPALGSSGSILIFNASYESRILKELAKIIPECKDWVDSVLLRFLDLQKPFTNFDYYNPVQKGSGGLKKVLPAITNKGYEKLNIDDGEFASLEYLKHRGNLSEELTKDLLAYCGLDTEGMVWILVYLLLLFVFLQKIEFLQFFHLNQYLIRQSKSS